MSTRVLTAVTRFRGEDVLRVYLHYSQYRQRRRMSCVTRYCPALCGLHYLGPEYVV